MATTGVLDKARKKIQDLKDTLADKERELAEQERAFAEKRRAELGALIDRAGGIDLADDLIAGVIAEARSIHERALDKQQEAVARVQEWRQRGKQFCRPAKKRNPKNPGQAAPDASPNQAHL